MGLFDSILGNSSSGGGDGQTSWGKNILGGALQGLGSGQGLIPGLASGIAQHLWQKKQQLGPDGKPLPDPNGNMSIFNDPNQQNQQNQNPYKLNL